MIRKSQTINLRFARLITLLLLIACPGLTGSVFSQEAIPEDPISSVQAEIRQLQASLQKLGAESKAQPAPEGLQGRALIEHLVRDAFRMQIELHQLRVDHAQRKLDEVKVDLANRKRQSDAIIARRIASLAGQEVENTDQPTIADPELQAAARSSQGWRAWQKQDFASALPLFMEATQLDPENANAQNGLGWTLLHLGKFERAIEAFELCLKVQAQHGGALNGIGQSLMALGRHDDAEIQLIKATQAVLDEHGEAYAVKHQITASWIGLVRLYLATDQFDKAKQWIVRYQKHDPKNEMFQEMAAKAERGIESRK